MRRNYLNLNCQAKLLDMGLKIGEIAEPGKGDGA
jgi:hypothetical protein